MAVGIQTISQRVMSTLSYLRGLERDLDTLWLQW
jgi:hypothetical protein